MSNGNEIGRNVDEFKNYISYSIMFFEFQMFKFTLRRAEVRGENCSLFYISVLSMRPRLVSADEGIFHLGIFRVFEMLIPVNYAIETILVRNYGIPFVGYVFY